MTKEEKVQLRTALEEVEVWKRKAMVYRVQLDTVTSFLLGIRALNFSRQVKALNEFLEGIGDE